MTILPINFYTHNQKRDSLIMGVFAIGLIVSSLWFRQFVLDTPLEMTCYLLCFVGLILLAITLHFYKRISPVLTLDEEGVNYHFILKKDVFIPWKEIEEVQFINKNWCDIPNTVTIDFRLIDDHYVSIGLKKTLLKDNLPISAKKAFDSINTTFQQNK